MSDPQQMFAFDGQRLHTFQPGAQLPAPRRRRAIPEFFTYGRQSEMKPALAQGIPGHMTYGFK